MAKPPPKPAGTPPTISGIAKVGHTLAASDGAWTGGPATYRKQWLRGTSPIPGATGKTYAPVEADVGHEIAVTGWATSDKGGESIGVTSESVGPVKAAGTIPPEPIPPDPAREYPASIITPVQGKPLPHVWDLQFGGTGAREFYNGHWTGEIDPYLASVGFVYGNYGQLLLNAGASERKVEGYSFKGAPPLAPTGEGANIILTDCYYSPPCEPCWPRDVNMNIQSGMEFRIEFNFCTWDVSASYQGCGETVFNNCQMTGQKQTICDVGGLNSRTIYNRCYIPGGGVQPANGAHVELARVPADNATEHAPTRCFNIFDTMVDVSACGQADAINYAGGWTGVWSFGDIETLFERCVMIGAPKVNASPTVPNSVGCVFAYGERVVRTNGPRITDCVLEPGCYGYSYNHSGTANRVIDGGGNRSLQNEALDGAELGRRRTPTGRVTAPLGPWF